jgi:ABC-type polysaccharide/polyol phosphate export permease
VQYGFFVTPIVYTTNEFLTKEWFFYYNIINPLASMVEFFRYTLINDYTLFDFNNLMISISSSFIVLLIGLGIFNHSESSFVDHL